MFVVILAIASVAVGATMAEVLRSDYVQNPEGSYNFGFEPNNGIVRNEDGKLKQVLDETNKPNDVVEVRGTYSYVDPTGKKISINYYADETGDHADGDSIAKAVDNARVKRNIIKPYGRCPLAKFF